MKIHLLIVGGIPGIVHFKPRASLPSVPCNQKLIKVSNMSALALELSTICNKKIKMSSFKCSENI